MDNPSFEDIAAGTVILRENAVADRVFIIDEGEVEVLRRVEGKFREMRRLGPGDFFGELSLLENLPSTDVVRAVSDCRLLTISQDLLPHVLRENIDVALLMIRRLSIRAEENQQLTLDVEPTPPEKKAQTESVSKPEPEPELEPEPEERADTPFETAAVALVPAEASLTSEAAFLHQESGTVLPLPNADQLTVGRLHIDFSPDLDLRLLDTQRSVSRLHAHISLRDDQFVLWEDAGRPAINGTFVNDDRLLPGQEHTLTHGDRLRFGTLPLVFRIGPPQAEP